MIRAFQLAIILHHLEPSIKAVIKVDGQLRDGFRRFRFKSAKAPEVAIPIELRRSNSDLDTIVEALAQETARLNLNPIPRQNIFFCCLDFVMVCEIMIGGLGNHDH